MVNKCHVGQVKFIINHNYYGSLLPVVQFITSW